MPTGKPRKLTPKGEQSRRRIVAAAAQLMFENGVAGTTVEQVREAAGVSSSQIYHYFADKEALVQAVIDHQNEVVVGGQSDLLAAFDTLDGIRAWRDAVVALQRQLHCRGGCPIASLGAELAEVDPRAREGVAAGFTRWEEEIRAGYRAMAERGSLVETADPDRLATFTLAAMQGGILLTQVQRSTAPLEAALDTVLDHIASLVVG